MSEVTQLLDAMDRGEPKAAEELLPLVYEELRQLASSRMAKEPPGQTLQATALVHEAYLRLVGSGPRTWENRAHFFAAAAEAMRRILIENARRKRRLRHGGDLKRIDLDEVDIASNTDDETLLQVDGAIDELTLKDQSAARLIKLRFYAGLSNVEAARVMGLSESSAKRLWTYARAWLYEKLKAICE